MCAKRSFYFIIELDDTLFGEKMHKKTKKENDDF